MLRPTSNRRCRLRKESVSRNVSNGITQNTLYSRKASFRSHCLKTFSSRLKRHARCIGDILTLAQLPIFFDIRRAEPILKEFRAWGLLVCRCPELNYEKTLLLSVLLLSKQLFVRPNLASSHLSR